MLTARVERGLVTPLRAQRAVSVLQCASCGTVVGTLDSSAAIEGLQKQIAAIDAGLVRIVKALQQAVTLPRLATSSYPA